jgi:hypothetical protein
MHLRVMVHKTGTAIQAWAPGLPVHPTVGKTEEEAVGKVLEEARALYQHRPVPVEPEEEIAERVVELSLEELGDDRPDAMPLPPAGGLLTGTGVGLLLLGITGVLFAAAFLGAHAAPLFLFLPIVVAALGVAGVVFGLMAERSASK